MNLTKEQFLDKFQENLSIQFNGSQNWWTKSLFHFTDIKNAISIIENEKIYSRNKAIELGLMANDNANYDVISNTNNEHKQFARLYFGPITPTQKNNEGIKPKDKIANNAHCPIPIMFIFDLKKVFLLENMKFTDGNLATSPNIYNDIFDLEKLNFHLIYHRTWFYPGDRDKIINARHSEVIIKEELLLKNNLRFIAVRSEAEKEFLIYKLSYDLKQKYQDKIFVQPKTGIFTNDWLYIEGISIVDNQININWHLCTNSNCYSKFKLYIELKYLDNFVKKHLLLKNWYPNSKIQILVLPEEFMGIEFELSIYVDDMNVYSNILV